MLADKGAPNVCQFGDFAKSPKEDFTLIAVGEVCRFGHAI